MFCLLPFQFPAANVVKVEASLQMCGLKTKQKNFAVNVHIVRCIGVSWRYSVNLIFLVFISFLLKSLNIFVWFYCIGLCLSHCCVGQQMYYGPTGAMCAHTCRQEQGKHCRASFMEHHDYKKSATGPYSEPVQCSFQLQRDWPRTRGCPAS